MDNLVVVILFTDPIPHMKIQCQCILALCQQFHKSLPSEDIWTDSWKYDSKAHYNTNNDFKLVIPEFCKDFNICEHIPDYPQEFVNSLLHKLLDNFLDLNKDMKQSEIPIRDDLILESEQLCNSKQKVFIPQAARSKSNAWHLILSSTSYPQTFIGEVCRSNVNNTSNCSKAIVLLNYYGKCVQKYIQRKMIALNEDMNKVINILVDVPSCCSCNLIRI
ncbi:uncharacterized protein LOC116767118 [Danaus plexippus]|uniref:uncharacterized protein LOC116767118 n=1 Tax=Danaus plexippus TaxID=13037 RepID=UPI002AB1CDFF|nr:uncharacterized protein LOC116767118 [Danaus plexippus]